MIPRAYTHHPVLQSLLRPFSTKTKKKQWSTIEDIKVQLQNQIDEKRKMTDASNHTTKIIQKEKVKRKDEIKVEGNIPKLDSKVIAKLGFHPSLLPNIRVKQLTNIQKDAFNSIINGKSTHIISPRGTGKSFAFLLPLLQKTISAPKLGSVIIICPTRDHCDQISMLLYKLCNKVNIKACAAIQPPPSYRVSNFQNSNLKQLMITGSDQVDFSVDTEDEMIRGGSHIIVGTSERVADMLRRGILFPSDIKTIVIDDIEDFFLQGDGQRLNSMTTIKKHQESIFEVFNLINPLNSQPNFSEESTKERQSMKAQLITSSASDVWIAKQHWGSDLVRTLLDKHPAVRRPFETIASSAGGATEVIVKNNVKRFHIVRKGASPSGGKEGWLARVVRTLMDAPPNALCENFGIDSPDDTMRSGWLASDLGIVVLCAGAHEADLLAAHPLLNGKVFIAHGTMGETAQRFAIESFLAGQSHAVLLATEDSGQHLLEILKCEYGMSNKVRKHSKVCRLPRVVIETRASRNTEMLISHARIAVSHVSDQEPENSTASNIQSKSILITLAADDVNQSRLEKVSHAAGWTTSPLSILSDEEMRQRSALEEGADLMLQESAAFWGESRGEAETVGDETREVFMQFAKDTCEFVPEEAEKLLAAALHVLETRSHESVRTWVSPLSGRTGFAAVIVHDPLLQRYKDRASVLGFIKLCLGGSEVLTGQVGRISLCRAGWVAELPVSSAKRVVSSPPAKQSGVLVTIARHLPKVVEDELQLKIAVMKKRERIERLKKKGKLGVSDLLNHENQDLRRGQRRRVLARQARLNRRITETNWRRLQMGLEALPNNPLKKQEANSDSLFNQRSPYKGTTNARK